MIIKIDKHTINVSLADYVSVHGGDFSIQKGLSVQSFYDPDAEHKLESLKSIDFLYEKDGVLYNTKRACAVKKQYDSGYSLLLYFDDHKKELKFRDEDAANEFFVNMIYLIGEHYCVECHDVAVDVRRVCVIQEEAERYAIVRFAGSQGFKMSFSSSEERDDYIISLNKLNNIKQL